MEERIEEQTAPVEDEKTQEQLFSELEAVTGALEAQSSLEKSFPLYHRGLDMLKACSDRIDRVEKQIQVLDEKGEAHERQYDRL